MKRTKQVLCALAMLGFLACNKTATDSQISLTPSTATTTVGQTVSVALTSGVNASNWTVTPSANVAQTYTITTSKTNSFTFSQAGVYTIAVRARSVSYDSTTQSLSSAWNASGAGRGSCTQGVDTASVKITVTSK